MRIQSGIGLAVAILVLPIVADAQPFGGRGGPTGGGRRGPPAFMADLYPPELIMRNQSELALSDAQKSAIMAAIREARDSLDPVEWELEEKQQKLAALVGAPTIDEAALLEQAEEVMNLEKQLKRSHLLLLVRIKNELTPEQQQKAKTLRARIRRGFGGGTGGRPRGGGPPDQ